MLLGDVPPSPPAGPTGPAAAYALPRAEARRPRGLWRPLGDSLHREMQRARAAARAPCQQGLRALPSPPTTRRAEQRLSKVKTPRAATRYLWPLQDLLSAAPDGPPPERLGDT